MEDPQINPANEKLVNRELTEREKKVVASYAEALGITEDAAMIVLMYV